MERLGAVATKVDALAGRVARVRVAGGELGRNDHLVADAAACHPLADPYLRLLILVVVGSERSSASAVDRAPNTAFANVWGRIPHISPWGYGRAPTYR